MSLRTQLPSKVPKHLFSGSTWLSAKNSEEIDKVTDGCTSVGCYTAQLPAHMPTVGAEIAGGTRAKAVPLIVKCQGWESWVEEPLREAGGIEGPSCTWALCLLLLRITSLGDGKFA